jgi:hypothetical protein
MHRLQVNSSSASANLPPFQGTTNRRYFITTIHLVSSRRTGLQSRSLDLSTIPRQSCPCRLRLDSWLLFSLFTLTALDQVNILCFSPYCDSPRAPSEADRISSFTQKLTNSGACFRLFVPSSIFSKQLTICSIHNPRSHQPVSMFTLATSSQLCLR